MLSTATAKALVTAANRYQNWGINRSRNWCQSKPGVEAFLVVAKSIGLKMKRLNIASSNNLVWWSLEPNFIGIFFLGFAFSSVKKCR